VESKDIGAGKDSAVQGTESHFYFATGDPRWPTHSVPAGRPQAPSTFKYRDHLFPAAERLGYGGKLLHEENLSERRGGKSALRHQVPLAPDCPRSSLLWKPAFSTYRS